MDLRSSFSAFVKAVPCSEFHNLTTICNASVKRVSAYDRPKLSRFSSTHRPSRSLTKRITQRLRHSEPSRISLRKTLHLLKIRKLRSKFKKLLTKKEPLSSVLYNIATNYKQWRLKYVQRQDSFYCYYFMTTKKAMVTHNLSKESIYCYLVI